MTDEDNLYELELRKRAYSDYERLNMAIDELERQTCDSPRNNLVESSQDCISKDEAIRIAEQGQIQGFEWQFKQLCNLSSVTPTTSWIPVSTKLPEIHEDVLLSLRSLGVVVGFRTETEPYFYCHGNYIDPQNVLAWMPLPEPYKAESEEEG